MTAEVLKRIFGRAMPETDQIQEIRLRIGKPALLFMDGKEYLLCRNGLKRADTVCGSGTEDEKTGPPVLADPAMVRELMGIFSRYSLYAFEDEIRQGFLTVEGGHRVGISGKAVLEGRNLRTIRDISSLSIRLAHEKKGCGDRVLPWLYTRGELENTLILSPPGAGKTTLLRDVVRQVSDGNRYGAGLQTAVVDERSELAACFKGVPQCDLGIRTDVMDGCPKALGMLMMIRSMAPGAVAVDEIGSRDDLNALRDVMKCGCRILATVHGSSVEDLRKKPVLEEMAREGMFSRYVVLSRIPEPGTVAGIYGERFERLAGDGTEETAV